MTLGEAIREFLKRYKLEDKIQDVKLQSVSKKVLGKDMARWIVKISFWQGNLTIEVNNAAVKQELGFHKTKIIDQINIELGSEIVKNIVIK